MSITFFLFLDHCFLKHEKKYTWVVRKWSRSVSGAPTVLFKLFPNIIACKIQKFGRLTEQLVYLSSWCSPWKLFAFQYWKHTGVWKRINSTTCINNKVLFFFLIVINLHTIFCKIYIYSVKYQRKKIVNFYRKSVIFTEKSE